MPSAPAEPVRTAPPKTPVAPAAAGGERAGPGADPPLGPLALRGGVGGLLMGLANLVPGISGGTMLLAAGVYPRFIGAIGEVSTLKFRRASLAVLGSVVLAALLAIALLAGPVKELVVHHRWAMYSLFIGLTLGGVPVVWRLIRGTDAAAPGKRDPKAGRRRLRDRGVTAPVWIGAAAGFLGMAALAVYQSAGAGAATADHNEGFVFMLLAGVAGASAMILPGVSGGYLLLVLGVYVPILAGVDAFKDGLKAMDLGAIMSVGLAVILPVGLGVVIGVVGVSNLLRYLLKRYERATLGVLLGLLLGAVVGLYPFEETVTPQPGTAATVKGQAVEERALAEGDALTWVFATSGEPVPAEDLPTRRFTPTTTEIMGALGLILLGFALTLGVDRLGREKPRRGGEPRSTNDE